MFSLEGRIVFSPRDFESDSVGCENTLQAFGIDKLKGATCAEEFLFSSLIALSLC